MGVSTAIASLVPFDYGGTDDGSKAFAINHIEESSKLVVHRLDNIISLVDIDANVFTVVAYPTFPGIEFIS